MLLAKYRISNQITLNVSTQNKNIFDDVGFLQKKIIIFISEKEKLNQLKIL